MNESLILTAFSQYKSKLSVLDKQKDELVRHLEDGFREILRSTPVNNTYTPITDTLNIQSDALVFGETICAVLNTARGAFYLSNLSRLFVIQQNKLIPLDITISNFHLLSETEKNIIISVCEQMIHRRPNIDLVDMIAYICSKGENSQREFKEWQKSNFEQLNKISANNNEVLKALEKKKLDLDNERAAFEKEKMQFKTAQLKPVPKVSLKKKGDVLGTVEQFLKEELGKPQTYLDAGAHKVKNIE